MSRGWQLFVDLYKEGKVTFSKKTHFGNSVSYRLAGLSGRLKDDLYSIIIELTETVPSSHGVFSIIKRLGTPGTHVKPCKYESEKGLADDIYEHLQKTEEAPVWCTDHVVALWSYGHHRDLVRYLDETCRSRFGVDPYWNGAFYMYGVRGGFPGASGDAIWEELSAKRLMPDLTVTYGDNNEIWIDFLLRNTTSDEEKRICRLVKAACDRHNVKPILENIDPSMMELGYDA